MLRSHFFSDRSPSPRLLHRGPLRPEHHLLLRQPGTQIHGSTLAVFSTQVYSIPPNHSYPSDLFNLRLLLHTCRLEPLHHLTPTTQLHSYLRLPVSLLLLSITHRSSSLFSIVFTNKQKYTGMLLIFRVKPILQQGVSLFEMSLSWDCHFNCCLPV